MEKILKEINKEKKLFKKDYINLLIGDGFDVNEKSSVDDVLIEASEGSNDTYETMAYGVGYIEGMKHAYYLLKQ